MGKNFRVLCALAIMTQATVLAGPVDKTVSMVEPAYEPFEHWELNVESGVIWKFGSDATPLNYTVLPQMITIKTPASVHLGKIGGGDLVIRNRFSLLLEPIVEGPESYYLGFSASGILEWWNASRHFSLFFAAGGGLGWMDSKGYEIEGAQGQDLNFNWFLYPGARYRFDNNMSVALGVYFQHISNTGLDDVNPGLNAIGPMLSVGWHF